MLHNPKNLTIALAIAVAGVLVLPNMAGHERGEPHSSASTAVAAPDEHARTDLKASTFSEDGKSVHDLIAFKEKLLRNLHRVMVFDPSMSEEELDAFENEMMIAAEFDERARKIMIEELAIAFRRQDSSSIFLLERVLQASEPGRHALSDAYTGIVLAESEGSDFYALQGLKNLRTSVPQERMGQLFDKALAQLDRYGNFGQYSPAMTFAAQAMKEGRYKPTTAQREALLGSIQRRQATATDQQQQFLTAQSLIWMTEPSGRAPLVERMLRQYPNRGTFSAVLESIEVGNFEPNARLMSTLEDVERRLSHKPTG